jgi:hypothetical protein
MSRISPRRRTRTRDHGAFKQIHGASEVLTPVHQDAEGVKGDRMIGLPFQNLFIDPAGTVASSPAARISRAVRNRSCTGSTITYSEPSFSSSVVITAM